MTDNSPVKSTLRWLARTVRRTARDNARLLRLDDPLCCFDRDQARASLARAKIEAAFWRS